jgi:hypothetical protein
MDDEKNYEIVSYELPEVVVPPRGSAKVVSRRLGPRSCFRPTGFSIPDDAAEDLLVTDVKIGANSQLWAPGAVPAGLFAESTPEARVRMGVLAPGSQVVLELQNCSASPVTFRGRIRGVRTDASLVEALRTVDPFSVIVGLGIYELAGGAGHMTLNVQVPMTINFAPRRLYVPRRLLQDVEVVSLTSERYLDGESVDQVPAEQLSTENLSSEGQIRLAPCAVLPRGAFFTVEVRNLRDQPRSFCGAVLLDLVGQQEEQAG